MFINSRRDVRVESLSIKTILCRLLEVFYLGTVIYYIILLIATLQIIALLAYVCRVSLWTVDV